MSDKPAYEESLALFKQDEKPEVVLLVGEDPQLVKIIVAWTNTVARKSRKPVPLDVSGAADSWEWLWRSTDYSRAELRSRVALTDREFDRKWQILVGNRILYPDGTINSFVQRYLREKVLSLFGSKKRKSSGKP